MSAGRPLRRFIAISALVASLAAVLPGCGGGLFRPFQPDARLDPPPGRYREGIWVHPQGEAGERFYWSPDASTGIDEFEPFGELHVASDTTFRYYSISSRGIRSPIIEAEYVIDDEDAPVISPAFLFAANVRYYSFDLNWDMIAPWETGDGQSNPIDDVTEWGDLEYAVYSSSANNIGSLSAAESKGRLEMGWLTFDENNGHSAFRYFASRPGERRYFNVFVRDAEGNASAYRPRLFATRPALSIYTADPGINDRIHLHPAVEDPAPTFATSVPVAFSTTKALSLQRYDGDVLNDLVIVHDDGTDDVYRLYLTRPDASFAATPYAEFFRELSGTTRRKIVLAQMDGTGAREAVYNTVGGDVHVADVEAGARIELTGANAEYFTLGDLDGNGFVDIVTVNETTGNEHIRAWMNRDGSSFDLVEPILSAGLPPELDLSGVGETVDLELADLDRDGVLDLVVAVPGALLPNPSVELYYGNGDGTFVDVVGEDAFWSVDHNTVDVVPADFDRDGWIDLFFSNGVPDSLVYTNNGDGTFSAGPATGSGLIAREAVAADLNGNGWMDIVERYSGANQPRIWWNDAGVGIMPGAQVGPGTTSHLAAGQVR